MRRVQVQEMYWCNKYVFEDHRCYQRADPPKPPIKNFIFLDYESRIGKKTCSEGYRQPPKCSDTCRGGPSCPKCSLCQNCKNSWCSTASVHTPNYCIAISCCSQCLNSEEELTKFSRCPGCGSRCQDCSMTDQNQRYINPPCQDRCGLRERIFAGSDVTMEVGKFVFSPERRNSTVIAHNLCAYDSFFMMDYLTRQGIVPDSIIYQGSHISYLHVKNKDRALTCDTRPVMWLDKSTCTVLEDDCRMTWPPGGHLGSKFQNEAMCINGPL